MNVTPSATDAAGARLPHDDDDLAERISAFTHYLSRLASNAGPEDGPDRAALAQLRRGLGRPHGWSAETARHVVPFLREDVSRERYVRERDAFFLVGTLFGFHPRPAPEEKKREDLGDVFDALGHHESAEGRFTALLNARQEELPDLLRQAVSLAKAAELSLNYQRLLWDVLRWNHPDRPVQLRWARHYWRRTAGPAPNSNSGASGSDHEENSQP
jgi:CRISPR system Cascade subunit CasB